MSPQTFVGNSNSEVEPSLAQKLSEGTGGPMLLAGMFESVITLLEAHGAPDSVKQAAENFKQEIIKWASAQSVPTTEPSHDAT